MALFETNQKVPFHANSPHWRAKWSDSKNHQTPNAPLALVVCWSGSLFAGSIVRARVSPFWSPLFGSGSGKNNPPKRTIGTQAVSPLLPLLTLYVKAKRSLLGRRREFIDKFCRRKVGECLFALGRAFWSFSGSLNAICLFVCLLWLRRREKKATAQHKLRNQSTYLPCLVMIISVSSGWKRCQRSKLSSWQWKGARRGSLQGCCLSRWLVEPVWPSFLRSALSDLQ